MGRNKLLEHQTPEGIYISPNGVSSRIKADIDLESFYKKWSAEVHARLTSFVEDNLCKDKKLQNKSGYVVKNDYKKLRDNKQVEKGKTPFWIRVARNKRDVYFGQPAPISAAMSRAVPRFPDKYMRIRRRHIKPFYLTASWKWNGQVQDLSGWRTPHRYKPDIPKSMIEPYINLNEVFKGKVPKKVRYFASKTSRGKSRRYYYPLVWAIEDKTGERRGIKDPRKLAEIFQGIKPVPVTIHDGFLSDYLIDSKELDEIIYRAFRKVWNEITLNKRNITGGVPYNSRDNTWG